MPSKPVPRPAAADPAASPSRVVTIGELYLPCDFTNWVKVSEILAARNDAASRAKLQGGLRTAVVPLACHSVEKHNGAEGFARVELPAIKLADDFFADIEAGRPLGCCAKWAEAIGKMTGVGAGFTYYVGKQEAGALFAIAPAATEQVCTRHIPALLPADPDNKKRIPWDSVWAHEVACRKAGTLPPRDLYFVEVAGKALVGVLFPRATLNRDYFGRLVDALYSGDADRPPTNRRRKAATKHR